MFLNCKHWNKYQDKSYCPFSFCCDLRCVHNQVSQKDYDELQTKLDNTEMNLDSEYKENDKLNDEIFSIVVYIKDLNEEIDLLLKAIGTILKDNNLKLEENMEYIPIKYIKYVKNWCE